MRIGRYKTRIALQEELDATGKRQPMAAGEGEAAAEEALEILEPYQLHFSDLLLLSSPSSSSSSFTEEEAERLEGAAKSVMEALGPSGPGLLAISGVPVAPELRRRLLPLARHLALLPNDDRRRILKDHGLGSDVPLKNLDRSVSSFSRQLRYDHYSYGLIQEDDTVFSGKEEDDANADGSHQPEEHKIKNLGSIYKELGICMMDLGIRLAQVCDKAIGGHELEHSILESCTAKGRLIHYHSDLDNCILKEASRIKGVRKGPNTGCVSNYEDEIIICENINQTIGMGNVRPCGASISRLWQQWHYDYGIFTVLASPMFISSRKAEKKMCVPNETHIAYPQHSYLQVLDPRINKISLVMTYPENFIVQVGESADILSKGKLRSTLHSVCKPVEQENMSRETFVVFLQPAWGKRLYLTDYQTIDGENLMLNGGICSTCSKELCSSFNGGSQQVSQEIHKMIPPLLSRLKDGMTFAEFSRETTRQYYGGKGVQSMR